MPKTKGDACRLIDNILGKKNKNPTLKFHRPKDVNVIVDEAAERARRQLEDQTPHYRRTPSDRAATSHLRLVGMDWPDASNEDRSGQDYPPRTQSDRGTGEAEAETEDDTHRSNDEIDPIT